MAILSAPRVECQVYYVPVKVRRPSSRYIKKYKKEYRKKRNKRERLHGRVKRRVVGISTDSSAVGDCSPQESIFEIQRARAHLTKTRPHMKKLLRGGRALGSARCVLQTELKFGIFPNLSAVEHPLRAALPPQAETRRRTMGTRKVCS